MSKRHKSSRNGANGVTEERDTRKAEHRKVRHSVNQALHVAAVEGDADALVLDEPHHTHPDKHDHPVPPSHAEAAPPKRVKHWKQPFWKRRKADRRRKAAELEAFRKD